MAAEPKGGITAVEKLPDGVPLYIEGGTVLRLRQSVLSIEEPEIEVTCGAGLGGDFVTMEVGDRRATFHLRDVLQAWVATFDPELAERLPRTAFEVDFIEGDQGKEAPSA